MLMSPLVQQNDFFFGQKLLGTCIFFFFFQNENKKDLWAGFVGDLFF